MQTKAKKRVSIVSVSLVKESSFLYEPRRCSSAISAYQLFAPFVENKDREHVVIAGLNTKHEPTMISVVHIGSVNQSIAVPREILKPLLLSNAVSCIVCHNHPSSDPSPSANDIQFTKKLRSCCELLNIELLDHLIIGFEGRYLSLRAEGYFEK